MAGRIGLSNPRIIDTLPVVRLADTVTHIFFAASLIHEYGS